MRLAAALAFGAAIMLGGVSARAAEYQLQSGDVLRVTVTGMPELAGTAPIDNDGTLRLPQFAPIAVAGSTLAVAQSDLRLEVAGRLVRRFNPMTGEPVMFSLAADDVHLTVEAFRPIHVQGAVGVPGALPFRPGMTARGALAEAGGVRMLAAQGADAMMRAPRLLGEVRALTMERARLRAEIWRLGVELGQHEADPAPDAAQLGVSESAAETLVAAQRRLLELSREQVASQERVLSTVVERIGDRIEILRDQEVQQREAVAGDEEEVTRMRRLQERGVVTNDRLLDIRRAQVQSATRLLATQSEISRSELERVRLSEELLTAGPVRDTARVESLSVASGRLADVEFRLAAAREEMEMAGVSALALADAGEPEPVVTVYRREAGVARSIAITLDDLLEPGDVVDVAFASLPQ